jgi:hypothetical protein
LSPFTSDCPDPLPYLLRRYFFHFHPPISISRWTCRLFGSPSG